MSNIAVGEDGKDHFATEFRDLYCGPYFCKNEACKAPLRLKNLGSDEKAFLSRRPYFSAKGRKPHIPGCIYANSSVSYESLQAAGFRVDDFFERLQQGRSDVQSSHNRSSCNDAINRKYNSITTVNKLYQYCMQHRDDDALPDGTRIFEVFQDDRNKTLPSSQRHASRLVTLRFRNCNNTYDEKMNCRKIWCMFPHTATERQSGRFYTLGFDESNKWLMEYWCKKLTPLKQRYGEINLVVGGHWNNNHCYITRKKQIFILSPT